MSEFYIAADLARCRNQNHKFRTTWSDKTPLKVSLQCATCTDSTGKSAYVAYGVEHGSFGQWRKLRKDDEVAA